MGVYNTLMERGFIEQATHDLELRKYLEEQTGNLLYRL